MVWTTGCDETARSSSLSPLDPLTPDEISRSASAVREHVKKDDVRFVAISLKEPHPAAAAANENGGTTQRLVEVIILDPESGRAAELVVDGETGNVVRVRELPPGTQPMFSPDDCFLAEEICKSSPEVRTALKERYGLVDMDCIAADPWSVHLANEDDKSLVTDPNTKCHDDSSKPFYMRVWPAGVWKTISMLILLT